MAQRRPIVIVNGSFTELSPNDTIDGASQFNSGTASSPGLFVAGSSNTGIYSPGANQLAISTNGAQRVAVDASGNVAFDTNTLYVDAVNNRVSIGTTSPASTLHVNGTTTAYGNSAASLFWGDTSSLGSLTYSGTLAIIQQTGSSSGLAFWRGTTEQARLDTSGRLLVGTSTSFSSVANLQVANANIAVGTYLAGTGTYELVFARSKSTTVGTESIISSGDRLGQITFSGSDGTTQQPAALIQAAVDGTPGANDMPGRLVFSTTADGARSPTERMRIDNAGILKVSNNNTYAIGGYHQFNQNAGSQWTLGIIGRNAVDPYGIRVEYTNAAPNNTVSQFLYCLDTAGVKAEIRSNGGLANFQANNVNLSDRNAKKDIAPAADTWDCIKEWEIVNYRYKDQPDDADLNLGVIAQQVAESCPEVITVFQEAKDDQPEKLGVKEQQMYWMAIKALQEAQVRIEQLEAKVAALESV